MLNALRLKDGFALQQFCERTGLAMTAIQKGLDEAERKGLIERDLLCAWPTARGYDFLNHLHPCLSTSILSISKSFVSRRNAAGSALVSLRRVTQPVDNAKQQRHG